jgi:hypothetical protein
VGKCPHIYKRRGRGKVVVGVTGAVMDLERIAIGTQHLTFSKIPIERKAKKEPIQSELFER